MRTMDKKEKEEEKKSQDVKTKEGFKNALSSAYASFDTGLVQSQEDDKKSRQEVLQKGAAKIEKKAEKELKS